jgi:membrane fusion protein (multidrug efflux system)
VSRPWQTLIPAYSPHFAGPGSWHIECILWRRLDVAFVEGRLMAKNLVATRLLRAAAIASVVVATGACSRSHSAERGMGGRDGGADDPVPVEVVTVGSGQMEAALRFSANLEAETQVQVLARTAGQVRSLKVEEGDKVKRGQVLLRMEDDAQRSALERIDAELAQAKRIYEKQLGLHEKGVASEQTLEAAELEHKRLKIAQKDAARALRYTTVRASVTGTVTRRLVKLGNFVNPNQHLFDITDFDSIVAKVFVPEKEMQRLRPGLRARVLARTTGESLREGVVDRIAPIVDPASGTIKVTIEIPDTDGLKPGMFVDVELVVAKRDDAVLLPRRALVYDNDEPYAFKLVGDKNVERVHVVPALENRDFIEPANGFAAGDRVVVAGQVGLKDKALVEARDAPAPPQ